MIPNSANFDWTHPIVPADDRPAVRTHETFLTRADLLSRAHALAAQLPAGSAALNLCERREHYLVALLALELRGSICLMPPSRAPAVLQEVQAAHPGSVRITDTLVAEATTAVAATSARALVLDPARIVAIGYTSGSTGPPKPNPKTWLAFAGPTYFNALSLRGELQVSDGTQTWIVATVPSQHMYGMEFTALLPLLAGLGIHSSHPLFPADIAAALGQVPAPRVLVTTPVHLRTLLESNVVIPEIAAIVSATAPLTADLAARVEARFSSRVIEFFGSTETCVIGSRRTVRDATWAPYPGIRLLPAFEGTLVEAPWLDAPVPMQDVFTLDPDGHFRVVGRNADMIEVAGKRTSLADLSRRLLAVPGVRDAVVLQPPDGVGNPVRRLVAFVVGDGIASQSIAAALVGQVDAVFIPRPIICVDHLPRNDVGKLPREQLLRLVREYALEVAEP